MKWVLAARHKLPAQQGDRFWTSNGDYTTDVEKALPFKSLAEATRWLATQAHVRASLRPVEIVEKGADDGR